MRKRRESAAMNRLCPIGLIATIVPATAVYGVILQSAIGEANDRSNIMSDRVAFLSLVIAVLAGVYSLAFTLYVKATER